jgi:hypothetical protein
MFWFYILHIYVLRVQYSCGFVLVFLNLAGNSFWCYVLSVHTDRVYNRVVRLCQFFGCGEE